MRHLSHRLHQRPPYPQRNHELRLLLRADDSQILTDALLQTIYHTHDAITQGHPPPHTAAGNTLLHAATRILDTVTTLLYRELDQT